jgi:hypothetical protein
MNSLAKRLKRIEAVLMPAVRNGAEERSRMAQLALEQLSNDDFYVLDAVVEQGKQPSEWTERASAAKALSKCVRTSSPASGYRNVQEFQRSCGVPEI